MLRINASQFKKVDGKNVADATLPPDFDKKIQIEVVTKSGNSVEFGVVKVSSDLIALMPMLKEVLEAPDLRGCTLYIRRPQ